jgi:hypothetical protein
MCFRCLNAGEDENEDEWWDGMETLYSVMYGTTVDRWNGEARRGQARTRRCDWAGRGGVGWGGIGAASAGQDEARMGLCFFHSDEARCVVLCLVCACVVQKGRRGDLCFS